MAHPSEVLFSIGEFSRATGLTIKALRFYHEEGLLVPAQIDAATGYRYYAPRQVETARTVMQLRELQIPVKDIQRVLASRNDDEVLLQVLERQRQALEESIGKQKKALRTLRAFIAAERAMCDMTSQAIVEEKTFPALLVAGIRTKGKYSDCGPLFGKLCRGARSAVAGPPMMLHYDMEYKENDADFEACVPLKQSKAIVGASVRELPGGRGLSLIHKGPYEEMGPSYRKLLEYAKAKGMKVAAPCREIYIKGPGMIFRGNPKNYITEIQMLVEST